MNKKPLKKQLKKKNKDKVVFDEMPEIDIIGNDDKDTIKEDHEEAEIKKILTKAPKKIDVLKHDYIPELERGDDFDN